MSAISERSIYGIINPLFAAAKNEKLFTEYKNLYHSISNALLHLNSINTDRRAFISRKVNQLFAEHPPEDHRSLLNFLKNFSIKKADGTYEGFIKPFNEYFTILNTPPQQPPLALQNIEAPSFSPHEFMANAFDQITENDCLEITLKSIDKVFSKWKKAAEKDYDTTNKMHLIEKTNALVTSLKQLKKQELEHLQIIFSQTYTDNDWKPVVNWVAKNSFSEFDGAYKSLNDLIELFFDSYLFPFPEGFGPESKILKKINKNKTRTGYNFEDICKVEDIRRYIFNEPETFCKIKKLNHKGLTHFKEDLLNGINTGLFSNQNFRELRTTGQLLSFFGERGCERIKRLNLAVSPREEKCALMALKDFFPAIQHLSLKDGRLNDSTEKMLEGMSALMELQLYNTKSFTKFNFLQHLKGLKRLVVNIDINIDLLRHLPKLEDLDLYIFDKIDALKELTHLKKLTLQFGNIKDHSFLENFSNLTYLNLEAQNLKQLNLNKHPNLTTLLIENGAGDKINIQGLPSLSSLSLNKTQINTLHLENLPGLVELNLYSHYIDTSLLQNTNITRLRFTNSRLLSDCSWLMKLPLEELDISESNVSNLKMISSHPTLKTIDVSSCPKLMDLRDLLKSKSLKTVIVDREWKIASDLLDQFNKQGIQILAS